MAKQQFETAQPSIRRRKEEFLDLVRRATLNLLTGVITFAISGCVGPQVLERQVPGYDEVTKTLDEKLLLLNIARVSNQEPVRFTSTSSIAATFERVCPLATIWGSKLPLRSIDPSNEQDDPDVTAGAGADYRPPCPLRRPHNHRREL